MKKIILAIAFVALVFSAKAWTALVDNASYIIARKYMTPQARAEYDRLSSLRKTVDYKWVADKTARATLNAELVSTTTCEKDIVVRLEKAVEVLRTSANHTPSEQYEAFVTVTKLIVALHTVSHIAIEGVENSKADFSFTWTAGKEGSKKYEKRGSLTWHKLWSSNFCFWHQGWSSEYYAYDIDLRFGKQREALMQGSPREWAHDMGVIVKPMFEWAQPGMVLANEPRLNLEDLHLNNVAKAAYRLAHLMNSTFK
jgi:hypothetical protein